MMECIPREIRGNEFLQDLFVVVKNVRMQGIWGGDMGDCHSVIVLEW
jgi:hypothetical protein